MDKKEFTVINLSLAEFENKTQINFTHNTPDFGCPKIQAMILSKTLKQVLTKEVQKEFTEIIAKDLLVAVLRESN